jgi:chromosome segregation ATPase
VVSADQSAARQEALTSTQDALEALQRERDSMLALFRKGRISERDLDRQLDAIGQEETGHQRERERLAAQVRADQDTTGRLETARTLLQRLHARLDEAAHNPTVQRELVHVLVASITVQSEEIGLSRQGRVKRRAVVRVVYCFEDPSTQASTAQDCRVPLSASRYS